MGRKWVLDTETKGTGASVVPLDKVLKPPLPRPARPPVPERRVPAPKPAEPKAPPRFKVVNALSREVMAEGADTPATVDLLRETRSMVDVSVYVWEAEPERWSLLSLAEKKMLWGFSRRRRSPRGDGR